MREKIIVLDFGAQYSQLIARRVRESHVYCTILPYSVSVETLKAENPSGIILSGGPASVCIPDSPRVEPELFDLGIPILGICYGHQLTGITIGGKVGKTGKSEYGRAILRRLDAPSELRKSRRLIARIKTIQSERARLASAAQASESPGEETTN